MQRLTQSRPDNCWQTCVAMLLDCPADALPQQELFPGGPQAYADALRAYLFVHHTKLTYAEIGPDAFETVRRPELRHIIVGETERTSAQHDLWHAVVGLGGEVLWDVHPSRAGLTKIMKWGLLVPMPNSWRADFQRRSDSGEMRCACGLCEEGLRAAI